MKIIKITTPQKFNRKEKELKDLIKKNNPVFLLEKFTNRKLKSNIVIRHEPIEFQATFKNNTIYLDFNNKTSYLWICTCHEMAHIILENPQWSKDKEINKFIKKHTEKFSKLYSFTEAIEQVLAILLQAACEGSANIRRLEWSKWKTTFKYMKVEKLGKVLWKNWLSYLKNISNYKNIDEWILEQFKKDRI